MNTFENEKYETIKKRLYQWFYQPLNKETSFNPYSIKKTKFKNCKQ